MYKRLFFGVCVTIFLGLMVFVAPKSIFASSTIPVATGVDESLFSNFEQTFYVAKDGSDSNVGTSVDQPFLTISKAVQEAKNAELSTNIIISPGIYRESVIFGSQSQTPLQLTASNPGTVTISGSDVWDGWSIDGEYMTHSWEYDWGYLPNPYQDVRSFHQSGLRKEMFFFNGTPLFQVFSQNELAQDATFYIDEAASVVTLNPPGTGQPSQYTVEVAVRDQVLHVVRSNVAIQGLKLTHANNEGCASRNQNNACQASRAVFLSGDSILFEDNQVVWNNWFGLTFTGSNHTYRGNTFSYNGFQGFNSPQSQNIVFDDTVVQGNNWRGAMGSFYDFATGQKIFSTRKMTITNMRSVDNFASGLWFDSDSENVRIENSTFCHNTHRGLMIEANQGPFYINQNIFCKNRFLSQGEQKRSAGLLLSSSENIAVDSNFFYDNGGSQVLVVAWSRQKQDAFNPSITRELKAQNTTFSGNALFAKNTQSAFDIISSQLYLDLFLTTLSSDQNVWYSESNSLVFDLRSLGGQLDLSGWQATTGVDSLSQFADPGFIDPDNCQFRADLSCGSFESYQGFDIAIANEAETSCQKSDINQDGLVDIQDYSILVRNFFSSESQVGRSDINRDGFVDIKDYSTLVRHFFNRC